MVVSIQRLMHGNAINSYCDVNEILKSINENGLITINHTVQKKDSTF